MKLNRQIIAASSLVLALTTLVAAQPAEVKDHPLVSRFAGSTVMESSVTAFDEYPLVLSGSGERGFKVETLEGKITHLRYANPRITQVWKSCGHTKALYAKP